jgi:arylsulfatase A-like enzyme
VRVLARNRTVRRIIGDQDAIGRRSADDINGAFLDWLDHAPAGRPFFAFLNFYDAHRPYLPPEPFASRFIPEGTRPDPRLARNAQPGDADRVEKTVWARNAYDGALSYLDDRLGRLFDELDRRGILDQTVVIVTSDHGEEFGEHGLFDHGNSLYRQATQVPLVIAGPGVPAAGSAAAPVSLRDLPRTVLDLALGRSDADFPGRSLTRFWSSTDSTADPVLTEVRKVIRQPEWYPASQGDLAAVISGRYRYIRNLGTGKEEVYDIESDPLEANDLAGRASGHAALPRLRATLAALRHDTALASGAMARDTVMGAPR